MYNTKRQYIIIGLLKKAMLAKGQIQMKKSEI